MPKLIERMIAGLGRKVAKKAVNSASWPYIYQPKEPDAVRNLWITEKKEN